MEGAGKLDGLGPLEVGRELDPHTSGAETLGYGPSMERNDRESGKKRSRERLERHGDREAEGRQRGGQERHQDGDSICQRRCIQDT